MRRRWTQALAALLVASACTGGASSSPRTSPSGPFRGGTLHARFLISVPSFDPSFYDYSEFEMSRCCLARTLLSYTGRPTNEGGTILHPDLADGMPQVSDDLLTWTFHLRGGLRYAPPLESIEIRAGDIVRALEREARVSGPSPAGYGFYYSVISGWDGYAAGRAAAIAGLRSPDDRTLVIQLDEPSGDLGYRLSLPAAAPIPANPADPAAPLGVAAGHTQDYGNFFVSSGPYMLDGSEDLDFSMPAEQQNAVSGLMPITSHHGFFTGGTATLVRNPSWRRSSDDLRKAYPDTIVVDLGPPGRFRSSAYFTGDEGLPRAMTQAIQEIRDGTLDLILDADPPVGVVESVRSDPTFDGAVHVNEVDTVDYIAMRVAQPPFDDIHVRKAFYLALDRAGLADTWMHLPGSPIYGEVPNHIAPDPTEEDQLLSYGPSWVPSGDTGWLAAARDQMKRSKYDSNHDGRCDAAACRSVVVIADSQWPKAFAAPVRESAKLIGIDVRLREFGKFSAYSEQTSPTHHWALHANRWGADYPNGSNFLPLFFKGGVDFNFPLLGASPRQLGDWGYPVAHVPDEDPRIERCTLSTGSAQVRCWADLDRHLMEEVVPWVPFLFERAVRVVSARVAQYEFDQSASMPALDQIALKPGST